MKARNEEKKKNPRAAVVSRLLSMAELFRCNAKITDEADEALEWEKRLRARAEELEQVAKAA